MLVRPLGVACYLAEFAALLDRMKIASQRQPKTAQTAPQASNAVSIRGADSWKSRSVKACGGIASRSFPVVTFQNFTCDSAAPAVASVVPSGENAKQVTSAECAAIVARGSSVAAFSGDRAGRRLA